MALKDKTIPSGRHVDPALAEEIKARMKDGTIGCAAAFVLALERAVAPLAVGEAADSLGIHLGYCQLGLFGFPGHSKAWESPGWQESNAPPGFEDAVRAALDPDGSLSCAAAWSAAGRFGIGRPMVGYLTDRMKIKIKRCQLGAF